MLGTAVVTNVVCHLKSLLAIFPEILYNLVDAAAGEAENGLRRTFGAKN